MEGQPEGKENSEVIAVLSSVEHAAHVDYGSKYRDIAKWSGMPNIERKIGIIATWTGS